jgi:hypothetical protein
MQGQFECSFAETPIIRTKAFARETRMLLSAGTARNRRLLVKVPVIYGGTVGVSKIRRDTKHTPKLPPITNK